MLDLPEHQHWRRSLNNRQGHQVCGQVFDADMVFDTIGIPERAQLAPVERTEGVLCTPEELVRINRQGDDLHIETQDAAPLGSRVGLTSSSEANQNALQNALLKFRSVTTAQGCLHFSVR